jgi:hypothetical protein
MTIIVDIDPGVQAELSRRAAAQGVEIGAYVATLLKEAANSPAAPRMLTESELENTLQEIAQFSHKIPLFDEEAFSRESLYRDHD